MTHPLSTLGAVHTALSLIPVLAGLCGFVRFRKIDPATSAGKTYLAGLALSVLTSFGLSSTGGFNPGHALGILALLSAFGGGLLVPHLAFLGRMRPYLAAFGLSFSFFLLMVPGINETLTRLPTNQPLASGPQSAVVMAALSTWILVFLAGFTLQCRAIRNKR